MSYLSHVCFLSVCHKCWLISSHWNYHFNTNETMHARVCRFICDITLPASCAGHRHHQRCPVTCRPDISRFGLRVLHVINHCWELQRLCGFTVSVSDTGGVYRSLKPQRKIMSCNVNMRKNKILKYILAVKAGVFESPQLLSETRVLCTLFLGCFKKKEIIFPRVMCKWSWIALDQLNGVKCLEFKNGTSCWRSVSLENTE